jgi:hypothetical protein
MATDLTGMFTTPEQLRQKRINDLMMQQASNARMGGSMDALLGQVAAAGNVTGGALTEAARGMFGLQSADEAKAATLNDMAGNYDLNTSAGLASFAKQLNDLGMTKESIMVMDKYQSVLGTERAEADRQERIAKGEIRTMRKTIPVQVPVWNTKKTEIVGTKPEMQQVVWTQTWNSDTKEWEPKEPPQSSLPAGASSGKVSTASGQARAAQGTTVQRPVPPLDPEQVKQDQKPLDPWDEFSRNGMM